MDKRKCGNTRQVRAAYELAFTSGREAGKNCVLVQNGALEVLFNKSNALDITWVKYKGVKISFLSKDGLNPGICEFVGNFEGGFLYTCGMDNISNCVEGKPMHGSMHYMPAENVAISYEGDAIVVSGIVREAALFGKSLTMHRRFTVTERSITISDTVENEGFAPADYVLLYHVNYGYPFLDECLKLELDVEKTDARTEIAKKRFDERFSITYPLDVNDEDCYYHTMKTGNVKLENPELDIAVTMLYDASEFPITLQWKSMTSGDYALGIEPTLTRFDDFKMRTLLPSEKKDHKIEIQFC